MFTCCKNDSSVINSTYSGQLQFSHIRLISSLKLAYLVKKIKLCLQYQKQLIVLEGGHCTEPSPSVRVP